MRAIPVSDQDLRSSPNSKKRRNFSSQERPSLLPPPMTLRSSVLGSFLLALSVVAACSEESAPSTPSANDGGTPPPIRRATARRAVQQLRAKRPATPTLRDRSKSSRRNTTPSLRNLGALPLSFRPTQSRANVRVGQWHGSNAFRPTPSIASANKVLDA